MISGLKTAAAGMEAQGERLAVLANNLANISAAGFKADHVEFFQSLSSPHAAGPLPSSGPAAPLIPPVATRTRTSFAPGALRETGNPLDLAIEGRGFFVVAGPGGERLTRAGQFLRGRDGALVTADGWAVLDPSRRPIVIPEQGRISVDQIGEIRVDGNPAGALLVVDPDPERLIKASGTRFSPPPDLPLVPMPDARVVQGAFEQSNVNAVLTLVEVIDALRTYEAAQRAARAQDETLQRAVNDVGRTA